MIYHSAQEIILSKASSMISEYKQTELLLIIRVNMEQDTDVRFVFHVTDCLLQCVVNVSSGLKPTERCFNTAEAIRSSTITSRDARGPRPASRLKTSKCFP